LRRPRVIYWVVFLDALLMFAIVPLLPQYARDLHLSKTQAGVAVGAYSGAVLLGSPVVGHWSPRLGARRLTIFGVALLSIATLALAGVSTFLGLFAVRVGQGFSSAISWTAGMAWLSEASPAAERGGVLGLAMSCASIGTLVGPVVGGALGSAYGVKWPFVILAAAAAALTAACLAAPPAPEAPEAVPARALLRRVGGSRLVVAALVVMTLVATVSGTLDTLVPLRMGEAGYSALAITALLTAAGVLATGCNYSVGLLFDRIGGVRIAIVSMLATAALVAVPVAFTSAVVVMAVFLVSTPPIAGQYAVAFPLCAAGADRERVSHAAVFGLLNVAWGLGFLVGPAAGAAIAEASSDQVTYAILSVMTVAVALAVRRSLALS
jgi:MFS transporter, DHA1 family, solute carrier family 18 (vesicular amine transporter), member 1/2